MGVRNLGHELETLFCLHERSLFVCALAITRTPERAEDAVQQAFYKLFRMTSAPENLKAYVYRAVRNAALDQVKRSPEPPMPLDETFFDPGVDPREAASRSEFTSRVEAALRNLSEDERETIVQHLYGELTFREIAELREGSINTITSWYRRGLEKLRTEIER